MGNGGADGDAHAGDASASEPEATIVIGQRLDDAAEDVRQRLAINPIDLVGRATIDRLPATSAADALRLAPGLQFDNQRGFGIYLSARGLDPSFHIVTLDGRSLAYNLYEARCYAVAKAIFRFTLTVRALV